MKIILYLLSLELLHIFVFIATIEIKFWNRFILGCTMLKKLELYKLLVAIINNPKMTICVLSFFTFFIVGFVAWGLIGYQLKKDHENPKKIVGIKEKYDQLSFISTYVVPLIAFSYDSWNQVGLYLAYLISLGFIYMKTGQYSINPTMLIWGFRLYDLELYDVELKKNQEYTFISRNKLEKNDNVKYVELDKDKKILIGKKK